eukprot:Selendium_serpulae@DN6159_c2_g1_i32.p1
MNELELQTGRRKAIPIEEALRTTKELLKLGHIKPQIVKEIYNHWIDRRQKLGKPLLRKFAPVAAPNDNGPFAVFRPRPKDRMILRRPRRNATDSIPKLNRLAEDFRHVDHLLCKIRARDEVKQRQIDKEDDPLCFRFFLSRHTNEAGQIGECEAGVLWSSITEEDTESASSNSRIVFGNSSILFTRWSPSLEHSVCLLYSCDAGLAIPFSSLDQMMRVKQL